MNYLGGALGNLVFSYQYVLLLHLNTFFFLVQTAAAAHLFSMTEGQHGRVINGTTVTPPHKYPWTVATYFAGCFNDGSCTKPRQGCGASILNEYFILTAAHCCFIDAGDQVNQTIKGLFVLTGLDIREKLEPWSQNLSVAECIVHELYASEELLHDIALIRVNEKIRFSDKVTPVNLPLPNFPVDDEVEKPVMAKLVGWGIANNTGTQYPKGLQEITLPIIPTDSCQRTFSLYNFFGENISLIITENMLCIGFDQGRGGACTGDSGGPVMVLNPLTKTYTQVGLVSWSAKPCGSGLTVSTRLSKYVHWISSHLQKCKPRTLI